MDHLVLYNGKWMLLSKAAALAAGALDAGTAEAQSKENCYTLLEAIEQNQQKSSTHEEPPELCAPRLKQTPLGKPVPEGTIIERRIECKQASQPLQPIERSLTKDEQAAFSEHWAGIDQDEARSKETGEKAALEMAEAAKWRLPYPVPEKPHLPPDVFLLCDAAKLCGYQNQKRFETFLRNYKYPPQYQVISRFGCEELLKKKRKKRRDDQAASKSKPPAKQVPEPTKPASKEN